VIRERASQRFVGEVGLADMRRDIVPALGDSPEIGWALARWAHGRGIATEAVRAVLEWNAACLRAPRTVCIVDPGNTASIRVAEKCGYRQFASTTYHGTPTLVFERT
jgi:RimJ/RimL family protein N-acetyltransferase